MSFHPHFTTKKPTGNFQFSEQVGLPITPMPKKLFIAFLQQNFTPNGPNYTHFNNKNFDKLYEASISEVDDVKRYSLYQKMDSILIEEAPIVPLYYDEVIRFTQKNVRGLGINPMNLLVEKRNY